jgi:hypothetical protein
MPLAEYIHESLTDSTGTAAACLLGITIDNPPINLRQQATISIPRIRTQKTTEVSHDALVQ